MSINHSRLISCPHIRSKQLAREIWTLVCHHHHRLHCYTKLIQTKTNRGYDKQTKMDLPVSHPIVVQLHDSLHKLQFTEACLHLSFGTTDIHKNKLNTSLLLCVILLIMNEWNNIAMNDWKKIKLNYDDQWPHKIPKNATRVSNERRRHLENQLCDEWSTVTLDTISTIAMTSAPVFRVMTIYTFLICHY